MHSSIMEKANQALRRGSIRLRSLNSGHGDLNMIISDIKEARSACKKFTNAQKVTWDDMSKWAAKEKNIALQETFHHLSELSDLWYEVQREFIGGIKRLQQSFELILESEIHLDKSRSHLAACEKHEQKVRKEFERMNDLSLRNMVVEGHEEVNGKLTHATALINAAQQEVSNKMAENEALKVQKVKEGMSDFSENFLEMANKSSMILLAHAKVVQCLPDTRNAQLENLKYTGSEICRRAVAKAKDDVHGYKKQVNAANAPPPPYTSLPSSPTSALSSHEIICRSSRNVNQRIYDTHETDGRYCEIAENPQQSGSQIPRYDLPPRENYENLAGAVGGYRLS